MNRRTFLKKLSLSIIGLFGLSGGTYYYAREIEPSMLAIKETNIHSNKIPNSFDAFKLLQFTDTHLGFHYSLDNLQELVNKIIDIEPDCIVFTGDLVDDPALYNWSDELVALLSQIEAPKGKYWIYGNHDHGGYGTDIVKETFEQANFTLLKNEEILLENDQDSIRLVGIDDALLGSPSLENALSDQNADLFTILLAHEPDFADEAKHFPIDVQLSGHSHGGQIQVPFFGHIYTPVMAQKYVEGHYQIGEHPLSVYVSRGLGTTRLPYRFLCQPEINVYNLRRS
ncbi:metallophosphoesterase [Saliterribacillus persicus]|uniref:Calcineurin-like phosphoesterase domain-containing protein n=1 Tax=Saliterribacillus persicus TaxID=930114 RepID=A0A368XV42_9BACI|nr:metallophosphoesterase [Saliterribacillus persicus]RCW71841.1 hypothetical protein DFR57_10523 [Saliterribacillus persicus]